MRSPVLSREKRLEFLEASFNIFREHYIKIMNAPKSDLVQQRFHSSCIAVFFGDKIFLRRMMNTIITISVAILNDEIEQLSLQRLGSHDLELFFGLMRAFSYFDHTYENAIHVAVCSILVLIRKLSHEMQYPIKINKRKELAGISLDKDINNQENIDLNCNLISELIKQLMLGQYISRESFKQMDDYINNNSSSISSCKPYKLHKTLHLMSGRLPLHRYQIQNYVQSVMLLPQRGSVQ